MDMKALGYSFRASGFIENPRTHKWEKNGINSSVGELPTTYMSEKAYYCSKIYIQKKRED